MTKEPEGDEEGDAITVRAYVHFNDEDLGNHYIGIVRAMSDEDLRLQVLAQARKDMLIFKHKYADLQELASVFAEIDKVLV